MNVVGLTGWAGSGKSTVANYLVEEHGFTRLSFAAPLKKMLRTLDPVLGNGLRLSDLLKSRWTEQEIKDSVYGPEYRRLLQVLGTDCIRAVDEQFWVRAAVAQMEDENGKYVFDDVRFPNEALAITGHGNPWGLWNIERPGYEAVNGHASEQWAGKMNERILLLNHHDQEWLHDQIDNAVDMAFNDSVVRA